MIHNWKKRNQKVHSQNSLIYKISKVKNYTLAHKKIMNFKDIILLLYKLYLYTFKLHYIILFKIIQLKCGIGYLKYLLKAKNRLSYIIMIIIQ